MYQAVREGYAAGWYPDGTGRWDESIDTGDVYGQLSETLGLENTAGGYQKISGGEVELMRFSLYAPDRYQANLIEQSFHRSPQTVY